MWRMIILGIFIVLLVVAIINRVNKSQQENFEERDN
jgi:hypothetical protein